MAESGESRERAVIELDTDELPRGPWIFGRQVREPAQDVEPGALVFVHDASQRFVGHALYNPNSDIRLRFLARGRKNELDRPRDFLLRKLRSADDLRRKVLKLEEQGDVYRIVHAEGDELSGLIVDRLGEVLVCEYHSLGFWRLRDEIESALGELYPKFRVVHRVPPSAARAEGIDDRELDDQEELGESVIHENGLAFSVLPAAGHKTGWFCDQRDNRRRVASYANGRDVLDLCTNHGGFALNAARAGARSVKAVDLDEVVLERAKKSAELNRLKIDFRHVDAFDYLRSLKSSTARPGLVVLDPHKLIASRDRIEEGLRKYSDWNALALACVRPGGLFASFSCSGPLDDHAFVGMLFQAARRAEREVKLLEQMGAAPDHPQRPEFSRSRYLKGALFWVE